MVPGSFARLAVVVDDFDVVAVRVEYVGGVVAVVVAGTLTRLAVAAVSGSGRIGVEATHVVVVAGERDVNVLCRLAADHGESAVRYADRKARAARGFAPGRGGGRPPARRGESG